MIYRETKISRVFEPKICFEHLFRILVRYGAGVPIGAPVAVSGVLDHGERVPGNYSKRESNGIALPNRYPHSCGVAAGARTI